MASGRPLFPGSTVEDELHLIFKVSSVLLNWKLLKKSKTLKSALMRNVWAVRSEVMV
jgi:hypothetical protein